MDHAHLNSAELQARALRKWKLFHSFMRGFTPELHGKLFAFEGMDAGQWSVPDFLVTPSMFRAFLQWLATPCKEVNPDVEAQTEVDLFILQSGPCGYSFTYVRVLSYHLLSFLEDKEGEEDEKGKYVVGGDVSAIRRENGNVMKHIAL